MSLSLCNSIGVFYQSLTSGGLPNNAGLLYAYAAGTSNPQATFADSIGTLNPNPIVLDASGRMPGASEVWLTDGVGYRLELRDSLNNVLKSQDNVTGTGSAAAMLSATLTASLAAPGGSTLVGFLQAGIGAVPRTVQSKLRETVSITDFGAVCDGVTDDTLAVQRAVDSFGDTSRMRTGSLLFPGPIAISDTILFSNKSIEIVGMGAGTSNAVPKGFYVKSLPGLAGKPMFKIRGMYGFRMSGGWRFIGDNAHKPSAAINFNRNLATDLFTNTGAQIGGIVVIGPYGGLDGVSSIQFDNGILFDGDNANNEFNQFDNFYIAYCTVGVNISVLQNANNLFRNLRVSFCGTGLIGTMGTNGTNWVFDNNGVDLMTTPGTAAHLTVREFRSELSGRLFLSDNTSSGENLLIDGGSWQIGPNTNADGRIISSVTSSDIMVKLSNFSFTTVGGYAGPTPTLSLKDNNASIVSKYLILHNVTGLAAENIDMTTGLNVACARYFELLNQGTSGNQKNIFCRQYITSDTETIDFNRFDGAVGPNNQQLVRKMLTELIVIAAAATTDTVIQIPANAVVEAVSVKVIVTIPTAATFTVTGTLSGTQFDVAGGVSTASGVGSGDVGTRNCPFRNTAAQSIRITPNLNPATNAGRVRVTIHYYQVSLPTS